MTFYKLMQPLMDAETDMGGSEGVTDGGTPAESTTDTGASDAGNGNDGVAAHQTKDENAKYAAARREAEAESKRIRDENESLAKDLGYSSFKEFQDAVKAQKETQQKEEYKSKYGIDPDAVKPLFDEFKKNDPDFIRMRESEANLVKNGEATKLGSTFPDLGVKSWADVEKLPSYEQIKAEIMKGNDLVSAYKLVHFDDIVTGKTAAAKQAAINNVNSKGHIQPTGAATEAKDVNIPEGEMKFWKALHPKWSDDQIKDYVSKHS